MNYRTNDDETVSFSLLEWDWKRLCSALIL